MKIPDFDENGNLPQGFYKCELSDLEEKFSKNLSLRRKNIMNAYKMHLKEIIETELAVDHWIDGSFITIKKYPNDIDLFTEFDGVKTDKLLKKDEIDEVVCNAQERFNCLCDSHRTYKYPKHMKTEYESYKLAKTKFLGLLFNSDRDYNLKGVINLEIDKIVGEL